MRTGFAFTLEHWNLYDASPAWRAITTGTREQKLARMKDPALREAVKRETDAADRKLRAIQAGVGGAVHALIVQWVNDRPELDKYVGKSLGQIGAEENRHPIDVMLDLLDRRRSQGRIPRPQQRASTLSSLSEMTNDSPYTIPGVS